jgi:6-phosphofructokinase 1
MEDHLINAAGNDVTPAFRDYLCPLLGADAIEVARLRGAKVEKAGVLTGG